MPCAEPITIMLCKRLPRLDLSHHTYYLTCCLDRRRPLFKKPALAQRLLGLYVAERDQGNVALHGYVIMPDHYHVLLTLKRETSVSAVVRRVHSLFGRWCRGMIPVSGRVWQRRFYDHVIRDEKDAEAKLTYMHANPFTAGVTDDPLAWRWSSYRFWQTGEGAIRCDPLE